MPINNCLFYAILDAIKNDKYVVIRKTTRIHKWPFFQCHFLTVPKEIIDKYAEGFIPIKETLGDYPLPLFKGIVEKGDSGNN